MTYRDVYKMVKKAAEPVYGQRYLAKATKNKIHINWLPNKLFDLPDSAMYSLQSLYTKPIFSKQLTPTTFLEAQGKGDSQLARLVARYGLDRRYLKPQFTQKDLDQRIKNTLYDMSEYPKYLYQKYQRKQQLDPFNDIPDAGTQPYKKLEQDLLSEGKRKRQEYNNTGQVTPSKIWKPGQSLPSGLKITPKNQEAINYLYGTTASTNRPSTKYRVG